MANTDTTTAWPCSVLVAVALTLGGCTPAEAAAAGAPPGDGPCALLTTAEVERAFPGTKPGRVDRTQEKYGVVSCRWDSPTGLFSIISSPDHAASESVRDEARGWTMAFLDPLRADAARNVRYEPLPGVGDEAIAIVEKEDAAKGFLQDGAILVVRRGTRQVSAMSSTLGRRDRAEALAVLAALGKAIASRLE
jgi:hypothetical protein